MTDQTTGAQLRRGVVGPCILALLATGPRYGLEIVTELDAAGQLLSSKGTVYPLLNRLSEAGWVSSYWDTEIGEKARRYYTLTRAGQAELERFRAEWNAFSANVDHLMARAVLEHGTPPPTPTVVATGEVG
jgi:PadR family transcriptional regulator PadR